MPLAEESIAILQSLSDLDAESFNGDQILRTCALQEAQNLVDRLQTPWEKMMTQTWIEPARTVATKMAIDMRLLENINEMGATGITTIRLAEQLGVDRWLLKRILRVLAATNVIAEVGADKWSSTSYSKELSASRGLKGGFDYGVTLCIPAMAHLAKYLKRSGFSTQTDYLERNFVDKFGTDFWTWLERHPDDSRSFNEMQAAVHHTVPALNLGAIYPPSELLADFPPNSNVPLLVDVGGGNGTDVEVFRQALPNPYDDIACLTVQDLPHVIEEATRARSFAANIEPMGHDFFLNHVLHDWPDTRVRQILENLRPAMTPGFSKLLVGEGCSFDGGTGS